MDYLVREVGPVTVIDLDGELFQRQCTDLEQLIARLAREEGMLLLLNLAAVRSVCSTSLHLLVHWHRQLAENGGSMVLCSVPGAIGRALQATRLDELLAIYPSEPVALAAMGAAPAKA